MWCVIPLIALVVGGIVMLQTRDAKRSVVAGVVSGLVSGIFMVFLIYTGVLGS